MSMTFEEARHRAATRQELCTAVKALIVERLDLEIDPALIGDDQPLFGRGLELDSIDTLELAVAIQEEFDVVLHDDDRESLMSINRLVDHVERNRP